MYSNGYDYWEYLNDDGHSEGTVFADFTGIEFIETDEISPDRKKHKYCKIQRGSKRPKYFELTDAQFRELEGCGGTYPGEIVLAKHGRTLYTVIRVSPKAP